MLNLFPAGGHFECDAHLPNTFFKGGQLRIIVTKFDSNSPSSFREKDLSMSFPIGSNVKLSSTLVAILDEMWTSQTYF